MRVMPPRKTSGNEHKGTDATLAAAGIGAFVKLKPGELSKEVNREVSVPGSFWGKDRDDAAYLYRAKVVEVELTYKFPGRSNKVPALRFKMIGSAADTVDDTPIWIDSDLYSQYVHPDDLSPLARRHSWTFICRVVLTSRRFLVSDLRRALAGGG